MKQSRRYRPGGTKGGSKPRKNESARVGYPFLEALKETAGADGFEPIHVDFDISNEDWSMTHLSMVRICFKMLGDSPREMDEATKKDSKFLYYQMEKTRKHLLSLVELIDTVQMRMELIGRGPPNSSVAFVRRMRGKQLAQGVGCKGLLCMEDYSAADDPKFTKKMSAKRVKEIRDYDKAAMDAMGGAPRGTPSDAPGSAEWSTRPIGRYRRQGRPIHV